MGANRVIPTADINDMHWTLGPVYLNSLLIAYLLNM